MPAPPAFHLAQINIARMKAPLDDPLMAGFVAALDPINQLADESEGFVWRLQDEEGDATNIRVFEDDALIVNLSVWASMDALRHFVYQSGHLQVMRQRKKWFTHMAQLYMALWWVPAGHTPTPEEGRDRLETLQRHGPTPDAFTFKTPFPPPEVPVTHPQAAAPDVV